MNPASQETDVFEQMTDVIDNLLLLLSDKERFVVVNRFDLESKGRLTLDSIGKRFSVTRERVRQIEKNALTKLRRNVFNTRLIDLQEKIRSILDVCGGVLKESTLFANLLKEEDASTFNMSTTRLAIVLSDDIRIVGNTIDFEPYVAYNRLSHSFIQSLSKKVSSFLEKRKNVVLISELFKDLKKDFSDNGDYSLQLLKSVFDLTKSIKVLQEAVGLIKWRHIHPKTLRDKIFFILRNEQKPMHFVDISNRIGEHGFDTKNVNVQAVHNELIRFDEFVLIGRGIYALKEWGYKHGTTKDVIISLLTRKEAMTESEIIKKVLEKRQVKPITIQLALKNGKEFVRVGRKKYKLKK